MKKVIINISDHTYEKLRLETIEEKKSISDLIRERILYKPFSTEVEISFMDFMDDEIKRIFKE